MNKLLLSALVTTGVVGSLVLASTSAADSGGQSNHSGLGFGYGYGHGVEKPGYGYGDRNHSHSGPPGKIDSDSSRENSHLKPGDPPSKKEGIPRPHPQNLGSKSKRAPNPRSSASESRGSKEHLYGQSAGALVPDYDLKENERVRFS